MHTAAASDDLLITEGNRGEIRRLTLLFADLTDSTAVSARVGPETYRTVVGRYRELVSEAVNHYEGHLRSTNGDGLLAVFGHPVAHENDVHRAVAAALQISRDVNELSRRAFARFGIDIDVRVGVHRGRSYLDLVEDDVYGFAPNLTARVASLAAPGTVAVSDSVAPLVHAAFDLQPCPPAAVKGVEGPIAYHRVVGESSNPPRVGPGPLVGRDREVGHLATSWSLARSGKLTTPGVVFRGESGIGKSRMTTIAAELVEGTGGTVVELVGSPFHRGAALRPVREFLERRCGIGRFDPPHQRLRLLEDELAALRLDAASLVPVLAPVLGITADHGCDVDSGDAVAEAVNSVFSACLGGNPGLVIAHDVHLFDQPTLDVIRALMKAAPGSLMVIVTGRDENVTSDDWPATVFDLRPLSDEQSDELIVALAPRVSAEKRAAVRARCDGVPLFIEQVVADIGAAAGDDAAQAVPDALYEPLFARLGGSAKVLPVVQAAAVIGRYVDRGVLRAVLDMSDDEFDDVTVELEGGVVLEPWGTNCWRFRRELLREVAAELSPPSVRRELHGRVADAIVERDDDAADWGLVAAHYEHAERFDDAVLAYERALWAQSGSRLPERAGQARLA